MKVPEILKFRSGLDLLYFVSLGGLLGACEGLMIYYLRLVGIGGVAGLVFNYAAVYVLFFSVPFLLLYWFLGEAGRARLRIIAGGFVLVVLGARIYRLHVAKLVGSAVGVLALALIVVIAVGSLRPSRHWAHWATVVPMVIVGGFYGVLIVQTSPDPSLSLSEPTSRPNIVWITADTLRADHLSQYEYEQAVFKAFQPWQEDFIQYDRSWSTSSWTVPSVASHLTSLYPFQHGKSRGTLMHEDIVTLPQVLNRAGYQNVAISNQPLVSPGWGFGKGFDQFYATSTVFQESTLIDILNEFWVEETMIEYTSYLSFAYDRFKPTEQSPSGLLRSYQKVMAHPPRNPFFLYLYFFDPHSPYNPSPKWYPEGTESLPETNYFNAREDRAPEGEPSSRVLNDIKRRYDGEINDVADKIDRVLSDLKQRGLYRESLILFTSDHGEKFWDHGGWLHGGPLYEDVTRVPLFVKLPGNKFGGETVTEPVDGVDLMPTILELLGVRYEITYEISGEPLVQDGSLSGEREPPIMEIKNISAGRYQIATVRGRRKLFLTATPNGFDLSLYRLTGDQRMDRRPLEESTQSVFRHLRQTAEDHQSFRYNPSRIGKQQREKLRGLGYIE